MNVNPKTLYHGSQYEITDGIVHVAPDYVGSLDAQVNAVFATSDFSRAKIYAVMKLIGRGWLKPYHGTCLFVEKINHNIPEKAYVYELDADGFEHDDGTEYYSLKDKKIKNVTEINIIQEIKRGNIKVYVLKEEIDFKHMSKQDARALWCETVQRTEKFELYKPVYYHGSSVDIKGDCLKVRQNFNSVQDSVVSGVFVTSEENFDKFFAINDCISAGHVKQDGKKIYLERLRPDIKTEFFIYSVYETLDNQFVHDKGTEYYATKSVNISERKKYNTIEEINKLGYEIYVFDESLKSKTDKRLGNNFSVQNEVADRINQGKYHRVDIALVIKQQQ